MPAFVRQLQMLLTVAVLKPAAMAHCFTICTMVLSDGRARPHLKIETVEPSLSIFNVEIALTPLLSLLHRCCHCQMFMFEREIGYGAHLSLLRHPPFATDMHFIMQPALFLPTLIRPEASDWMPEAASIVLICACLSTMQGKQLQKLIKK